MAYAVPRNGGQASHVTASTEHGVEQQKSHRDLYLEGFTDGMTAASAERGISDVTFSCKNPDLDLATIAPLPEDNYTSILSSSQPSRFLSGDHLQNWPAGPPGVLSVITDPCSYGLLSDYNTSSGTPHRRATEYEIFPTFYPTQHTVSSGIDKQGQGEPQPFVSEVTESYHTPSPGFLPNRHQLLHVGNARRVLPSTNIDAFTEIRESPDGGTNVHKRRLDESSSDVSLSRAIQRPQHKKSRIPPSPSDKTVVFPDGSLTMEFRAFGSKRSKLDAQSKSRTALTRKIGACVTCRGKKIRCDQSSEEKYVPCSRCARLSVQFLSGPCCRIELIDIKLFRRGLFSDPAILAHWRFYKELGEGPPLLENGIATSESPRRVYLTHDFTNSYFPVTISRFQPGPDDTTAYYWTDAAGDKREYELPPFCISDIDQARRNLPKYFIAARWNFPKTFLANSNPIVQKTFVEAERYFKATKISTIELVDLAVTYWSATRMTERWWLICGTDLLGLPPMKHNTGPCRRNPNIDGIPVTPIMDSQLDLIVIQSILNPLVKRFLGLLTKKTLARKKEDWYEIYLASFVALHSAERILEHQMDYAQRFGISGEPKSNAGASLSHAYHSACKTILSYFHFASGGAIPLWLDWDHEQEYSGMTPEQIAYLHDIQAEVSRQDAELRKLKDLPMHGNEMYWCHQLLFPDWKADMPHRGKFLEFTEKDFLCS